MNEVWQKSYTQGVFKVFDDKPSFAFHSVNQDHTNIITPLPQITSDTKSDGIIAKLSELEKPLAIKTADCMPVLYLSQTHVALVHAGWRGLRDKILVHPLLKNIEWEVICFAPCISSQSFEVTQEFKQHFPQSPHFHQSEDKMYFDLQSEAIDQMTQELTFHKIDKIQECTFMNSDYNSYRRDKTDKRNWNLFFRNI